MTPKEAIQLTLLLSALFPGRLPEETQRAWALDESLRVADVVDAFEAARRMARTKEHPSLASLLEELRLIRDERRRRAELARTALTARTRPSGEQEARSAIAREVAVGMVLGRKKGGSFEEAFKAALEAKNKREAS